MSDRRPPIPRWPSSTLGGKLHSPCRWCGELALKPDGTKARAQWHPDCVTAYRIAVFGSDTIRHVYERDRGRCAACGEAKLVWRVHNRGFTQPRWWSPRSWPELAGPATEVRIAQEPDWEADHVVPLWSVDRTMPWVEVQRFWSLANLQTLCRACHVAKTAREAAERATQKRLARQPDLLRAA